MHFVWFSSTFLRVLKFLQITEWGPSFMGELILQKVSIIWSSISVFEFQKFYGPKFIVIHEISMHSARWRNTFLRVLKFLQVKEGGPDFWGKRILQKVSIISSPVLYFNFRKFKDPNFFSLIRFQCILYDSVVHFWESWNFYKLKSGDLVSWGNQFCRKSQLFGPPFCSSILKVF